MAMYTLSGKFFIDDNDEIYMCQRPLYEDDESLGRRFTEKTTASHTAKLYPHREKESPRRQAVIISHQMQFKPASKKKVDAISARLSGSKTFATRMRTTGASSEPSTESCPRRVNEEEKRAKERPTSPKPVKSVLKTPLRTTPRPVALDRNNNLKNKGNAQNPTPQNTHSNTKTQTQNTNKVTHNKSQDTRKNVRFNSAGSKKSQNSDTKSSNSNTNSQKPGAFLRMLLDEQS